MWTPETVTLEDLIPPGEVWFLPPSLYRPRGRQTVSEWLELLVKAAEEGHVGIMRNVGPGGS